VQTQGTFKHINEVYQTMWFVNFHYQNVLEAFAHFTQNYGSSRTINNVKNEETIFINDNGVLISNSQIEGNIINAPIKRQKSFMKLHKNFKKVGLSTFMGKMVKRMMNCCNLWSVASIWML